MNLEKLREQIDEVDSRLLGLFEQRMELSLKVADEKRKSSRPVFDPEREAEKMAKISRLAEPTLKSYAMGLYDTLFELSKSYQRTRVSHASPFFEEIQAAVRDSGLPKSASIACPGVEGSFSQLACEKLFAYPRLVHLKSDSFEKVFDAIHSGLCEYGVLPLENNTTGLVGKIYDLMQSRYSGFKIVGSVRVGISHNLLAPAGVKIQEIRELFSHEQALRQCGGYIENRLPGVKLVECENTSIAAQKVAESGRKDVGAICSLRCAELYHLNCLERNVQDSKENYTRFICISKNLEIYPGANRTSIIMVLPHRPGALAKALTRFYSLGLNLTKLESRPLFEQESEKVMFYLDFEASPHSEAFARLMDEMRDFCQEFAYLGSYLEVV